MKFLFHQDVMDKIKTLSQKLDTEWHVQPLSYIDEKNENVIVYDLIVPKQRVNGSGVEEFNDEETLSIYQAIEEQYGADQLDTVMSHMQGIIHSHAKMGFVTLSADDKQTLNRRVKDTPWGFSLITNKAGDWGGTIIVNEPFKIVLAVTKEHIGIYNETAVSQEWYDSIKDRITPSVSTWQGQNLWQNRFANQKGQFNGTGQNGQARTNSASGKVTGQDNEGNWVRIGW